MAPQQNTSLCLLFSVIGSILITFGDVCVIIPHDREERGEPVSRFLKVVANTMNILLQVIAAVFWTYAPMFGPVALYGPTTLSARLISNLIVVGFVMNREKHDKDTTVATLVIVLATVVLPIVGPQDQDSQDIMALLMNPIAMAWTILLVLVFAVSSLVVLFGKLEIRKQLIVQASLLGVGISSSVLSGTVARAISISSGTARIITIVFYVIIQLIWAYETLLEATLVKSRVQFVPLYSSGSMIFNAVTGVIVWEDWKVMSSWTGYVCMFIFMVLGVYLMSDLKFAKKNKDKMDEIHAKRQKELREHGLVLIHEQARRALNYRRSTNVRQSAIKEIDEEIGTGSFQRGSTNKAPVETKQTASQDEDEEAAENEEAAEQ